MSDPIQMAVSHGGQAAPSASLTPDDYQQILDLIKAKDPRGMKLAQTLSPEEQQTFFDFQKQGSKGKDETSNRADSNVIQYKSGDTDIGLPPEALAGGAGQLLKGLPSMAGAVGKLGPAIKGGVGSYLGFEGAQSVGKALGVPGPLRDLLSMMAAHKGGSMAGGGAAADELAGAKKATLGERVMPMSDEAYEAAAGHPRGQFPQPPAPPPAPTRADMPPNVDFHRTNADLAEQVGRGVQNDFRGPVSFQQPPAAPVVPRVGGTPGEQAGATSLDQLQKAMGSDQTKGNGLFRETANDRPSKTPRPPEYPSGTNSKTPPDVYEQAQKDWAESHANYDAFEAAQQKIREALDRAGHPDNSTPRSSTLRKRKKD